jgi:uncharacterized protein YndB with AHSA1/START domain
VIEPSTRHATFAIDRKYDFAPKLVFRAFANPAAKRRWFAEGEGWQIAVRGARRRTAPNRRGGLREK